MASRPMSGHGVARASFGDPRPTSMTVARVRTPCRMIPARYSPTALTAARILAMRFALRMARHASWPPRCGHDEQETLAKLDVWNAPIHRFRARIEKIFGTWKRCYGLRRMRWRGLARAAVQVRFTALPTTSSAAPTSSTHNADTDRRHQQFRIRSAKNFTNQYSNLHSPAHRSD